ncbi:hypothetical protein AAEH92_13590 [Shewanella xiamenensis]|uniref:hypothetical protein n=1 Tax=Shewanella xiamenensis TaxID=332186 RepID=UPI00313E8221
MKTKAIDLITNNAEVVFDSLLENGLLKDIPFLGSIVGALRLKGDVTNYLFAKKIEAFISQLKKGEIEDFDAEIADKEQLQKIGVDLVFILERASNIDKAKWIAEAVIGLVEKRYDLDTFEILVYVIERFSPTLKSTLDVWYLKRDLSNGQAYAFCFDGDHPEELANLGLLRRTYEAKVANNGFFPVKFEECNLGLQLWNIIEKTHNK